MTRIFDLAFWFTIMPQPLSRGSSIFFAVFFGFFGVLAFAAYYIYRQRRATLERPYKELFSRVRSFLMTLWLVGWLWLFFAYEGVRFLSARFWLIVLAVVFGLWVYSIVRYAYVEMPRRLKSIEERKVFNQYLPKRKK